MILSLLYGSVNMSPMNRETITLTRRKYRGLHICLASVTVVRTPGRLFVS